MYKRSNINLPFKPGVLIPYVPVEPIQATLPQSYTMTWTVFEQALQCA
jgi:hypothetical protein